MKTIEQEKKELIEQAKLDSSGTDFVGLWNVLDEMIERLIHYAYDAGYERGLLDG